MPKMKSHSGAKKRFKVTASGKWRHRRAGRRHLLAPARSSRARTMRKDGVLNNTDGATIRRYLPYS